MKVNSDVRNIKDTFTGCPYYIVSYKILNKEYVLNSTKGIVIDLNMYLN